MILHSGLPRFMNPYLAFTLDGFYEGSLPSGCDIVRGGLLDTLKSGPYFLLCNCGCRHCLSLGLFQGRFGFRFDLDYFWLGDKQLNPWKELLSQPYILKNKPKLPCKQMAMIWNRGLHVDCVMCLLFLRSAWFHVLVEQHKTIPFFALDVQVLSLDCSGRLVKTFL